MPNNKDLFESLHSDYQAMVLQMCLGFMKGDRDLAKDLSQQVFINTWQALNKFNNASSYKTWIYRITVNTCLKYIRDKKDNYQVSIDEEHIHLADVSGQASDKNHLSLYQAIGRLGEVDRLIIMMVLDELDYEEISTIIGISEGTLRVKIHRIKKNLKTILENE
ncbi:MAG: sigma-70 family RNA polymerase sigma factor [Ferruginibacter sp.]